MHPSPISATSVVPMRRRFTTYWRSGLELLLHVVQGAVAGEHLRHAGVGLAALADRGEELAVLQFDAVHRHRDLGDVDLLFFAVHQIVVASDVGAVVADVAKERSERAVIVERQRQRAERARCCSCSCMDMSMAMPSVGWRGPCRALALHDVRPPVWYLNRSTVCAAWCHSKLSVQERGSPSALVLVRRKK